MFSAKNRAIPTRPFPSPARNEAIAAVAAASNAFYAALSVLDDGTCMETVWANAPYVTYVGPDSTSVTTG